MDEIPYQNNLLPTYTIQFILSLPLVIIHLMHQSVKDIKEARLYFNQEKMC